MGKRLRYKNLNHSFYITLITISLFKVTSYTHYNLSQFKRKSLMPNRLLSFQWFLLGKTEEKKPNYLNQKYVFFSKEYELNFEILPKFPDKPKPCTYIKHLECIQP